MEKSKILVPVSEYLQELGKGKSKNLFVNKIIFGKEGDDFSKFASADVVLMGVTSDSEVDFSNIRAAFYGLYSHGRDIEIVDVGNILYSKDRENELEEIFNFFIESNCYLILLGSTPEALLVYYKALHRVDNRISISCVAPSVSLENYLGNVLEFRDHGLFDFNIIGHQLYLSDPCDLELLSSHYFKSIRLGELRANIANIEPSIRDSQLFGIDISAVRRVEAPQSKNPGPNGLYAEEVCQLARYSGISESSKLAHIWGFNQDGEIDIQTSGLIAQIMWHLFDGFVNRINETVLKNVNTIVKFIVSSDYISDGLVFYYSKISNRWWMEIQRDESINTSIVACLPDDYRQAGENELPMRWIWYHQKMNLKNNVF